MDPNPPSEVLEEVGGDLLFLAQTALLVEEPGKKWSDVLRKLSKRFSELERAFEGEGEPRSILARPASGSASLEFESVERESQALRASARKVGEALLQLSERVPDERPRSEFRRLKPVFERIEDLADPLVELGVFASGLAEALEDGLEGPVAERRIARLAIKIEKMGRKWDRLVVALETASREFSSPQGS